MHISFKSATSCPVVMCRGHSWYLDICLPLQIPHEDGVSFHERIAKSELVLVDGADHSFERGSTGSILIQHTVHFLTTGAALEYVST